jgi:hypothetical protein
MKVIRQRTGRERERLTIILAQEGNGGYFSLESIGFSPVQLHLERWTSKRIPSYGSRLTDATKSSVKAFLIGSGILPGISFGRKGSSLLYISWTLEMTLTHVLRSQVIVFWRKKLEVEI